MEDSSTNVTLPWERQAELICLTLGQHLEVVYSLLLSATYTLLNSVEDFQEGGGVLVGEYDAYRAGTRLCWMTCVISTPPLFTGTRDKSGRAVAIITTRSTAWLNPHCNTAELVRLLLYLHSIPRFVMLLGWQLLPCLLCLSWRWGIEAGMEGGWLYWPRNLVQTVLKLPSWESPACVQQALCLFCICCVHMVWYNWVCTECFHVLPWIQAILAILH